MANDDDEFFADLDAQGLPEVERKLRHKAWNAKREPLVLAWVEKTNAAIARGDEVAGVAGRNAERADFVRQLEEEGYDAVNSYFSRAYTPGTNAAKFHWTLRWLIENDAKRAAAEKKEQAAKDQALQKHNGTTRGIALGALLVSIGAFGIQIWIALHPMAPVVNVTVPQQPAPVINIQTPQPASAPPPEHKDGKK